MKQIKGLKIFPIKDVVERNLEDLKVNKVCMFVFNIIKSCRMVVGNKDCYYYFEKHDQGKRISSSKGMQECISHTR